MSTVDAELIAVVRNMAAIQWKSVSCLQHSRLLDAGSLWPTGRVKSGTKYDHNPWSLHKIFHEVLQKWTPGSYYINGLSLPYPNKQSQQRERERERAPNREERVWEMMITKNQVQFFYKPMSVNLQTGCKRNKALISNKDPFSVSRIIVHQWGEIGEQMVITSQQCNLWCC